MDYKKTPVWYAHSSIQLSALKVLLKIPKEILYCPLLFPEPVVLHKSLDMGSGNTFDKTR